MFFKNILLPLILISTCTAFSAKSDAENLRKAMKPWFSNDEDTIIQILCRRTHQQRREIFNYYRQHFGIDLISKLKNELSGGLETLLTGLLEIPAKYDAKLLYDAMFGKGTDDQLLIEIMVSRSNKELEEIRNYFEEVYPHSLEYSLNGDTSGDFRTIIMSLAAGNRDESTVTDSNQAREDAIRLYNYGGLEYDKILSSRSHAQLRLIFEEFQKLANKPLEDTLTSTFNNHDSTLQQLIQCVKSRSKYFRQQLEQSASGFFEENRFIRIFVSQEQHLREIGEKFGGKMAFEYWIGKQVSGNLHKALITLVRFWWDL